MSEEWVREQGSWKFGVGNHPATVTVEIGHLDEMRRFVPERALVYPSDHPEFARPIALDEVKQEHRPITAAGWYLCHSREYYENRQRESGEARPIP